MVRSGVSNFVAPPQGENEGKGKSLGDVFGEILGGGDR
jgi:hypothetical protein